MVLLTALCYLRHEVTFRFISKFFTCLKENGLAVVSIIKVFPRLCWAQMEGNKGLVLADKVLMLMEYLLITYMQYRKCRRHPLRFSHNFKSSIII